MIAVFLGGRGVKICKPFPAPVNLLIWKPFSRAVVRFTFLSALTYFAVQAGVNGCDICINAYLGTDDNRKIIDEY